MSGLLGIAISVRKTCGLPTVNLFDADLKGVFVIQFHLFILPAGEGTTFESQKFNRTWGRIP